MSEQQQVELPEQPVINNHTRRNRKVTNQQLKAMPASQVQEYMLRDLRNWGWGLVVLGAIHLFTSGFLYSTWGVMLIVVGLASFFFKDAAMFVVYSITLAWAALSNLTSFSPGWGIFSILQVVWTVQVFRRFQLYHKAQTSLKTEEDDPLNFSSEP